MAHFYRIIKARRVKKKWTDYVLEKVIGLNEDEDESYSESSKCSYSERNPCDREFNKFVIKTKTPFTGENIIWKSFLGFIGGVLLTIAFFIFFHVGVNFSLGKSTYVCELVGIVLCLGLAFSSQFRCNILLLLATFFSKQGRQALLTYALFLAFTGPGRNSMHNMGVLSESMACNQEMVKRTLKQINDMCSAPVKGSRETLQRLVKAMEGATEKIKKCTMKIKRLIMSILEEIKAVGVWLGNVVNVCNKKMGTPFQRCVKAFDESIADCKAKLGVANFLCHVVRITKALCYTVKSSDCICLNQYREFVSDRVVGPARKKLRNFHANLKTLFYVSLEFNHSCKFETTPNKAKAEMSKTILQKLSKKMEKLQTIFSFFGFVFSLLFVLLFLRVYYYRYKYLSSDSYDNVYISKYIIQLDVKRARMDRETVLPLEPREKKLYSKPTAIRLLRNEKSRIADSLFLLGLTSFKIITFLFVDYSLYWILITVYEAGRQLKVEESRVVLRVEGNGILADFYRKLGKALQVPKNPNTHLNPLHCLPDPSQPDIGRYIQIGFLVTLCWILTLTEAYGLRLRNVVMSLYYPDRARERAVWLYNHIIQSRCSFIRYWRRQLRRKSCCGTVGKVSPMRRLFADFPFLGRFFFARRKDECLICGVIDCKAVPLKRCGMPFCQGGYCAECFACLENMCTLCRHPLDYGDISDISEEVDSSEENFYGKRYSSGGSETGTDYCQESDDFLTFVEMEKRDEFRDMEANRLPDYAKLGDLYSDRSALQARLKAAIRKRLLHLEREKERASETPESRYQSIRCQLTNAVCKLKNNKMDQLRNKKMQLKEKFMEKICNLRNLKEWKVEEDESEKLLDEGSRRSSRVSFKFDEDDMCKFALLKNELKERIKLLEKRKNLSREDESFEEENLACS